MIIYCLFQTLLDSIISTLTDSVLILYILTFLHIVNCETDNSIGLK
jgi:hypothetical protein